MFHRRSLPFILITTTIALGACASAPDDEPVDEPETAITLEQPLSACVVASSVAAAATGFAVSAFYTAGACAGGTLVTTAGTTTPVCVIPAGAGAVAILASVAAGGIAYLACSQTGTRTITRSQPRTRRQCNRNEQFIASRFDNVAYCMSKSGSTLCTTSFHFPCAGPHYHGTLSYNVVRGENCVRVQKRAVRCAGMAPFSGPCQTGAVHCGQGGSDVWGTHEY